MSLRKDARTLRIWKKNGESQREHFFSEALLKLCSSRKTSVNTVNQFFISVEKDLASKITQPLSISQPVNSTPKSRSFPV